MLRDVQRFRAFCRSSSYIGRHPLLCSGPKSFRHRVSMSKLSYVRPHTLVMLDPHNGEIILVVGVKRTNR